jgi:uncharacterized cofD-like protein
VLQHRFAGRGELNGHVVGNVLIVALWELLGEHVHGLDWVGRLLDARGRVLPMAVTPLDITAEIRGLDPERPTALTTVRGQVEVATSPGEVVSISLDPVDPVACPESVAAIREADWVVLGPGSWFTSVIPHLLVPDLRRALVGSPAGLVVVLNLEAQAGETGGFSPEDHLTVLLEHAPDLTMHTVLADRRSVTNPAALDASVGAAGARLVLADVAADDGSARHDPVKLATAYTEIMGGVTGSGTWR